MEQEEQEPGGVAPSRLRRALGDGLLASRLTSAQIELLASRCVDSQYGSGDLVLREGQESDRLFLIEDGRAEVVKSDRSSGETFIIRELGPGELFGDMSFLDGQPVSAAIRIAEPARLLSVTRGALEGGDDAQRDAYEGVLRALATVNVVRLRTQNDAHVVSLRAELESTRMKNQAAQFLILMVIIFGIQNFTSILVRETTINMDHPLYEWGMLLLFLMPTLYFARRFDYSWADMGVTTRNWKRALRETALTVPLLTGAAILAVVLLRRGGTLPDDTPLFTTRLFYERPWEFVVYVGHAGLQELGSRGIFQGSLQRFLGPEKGLQAVLVISFMFGVLHLHLGLALVSLAFFGSLFFGYLYLRHGTLLGVTLLHYVVGILAQLMDLM